jgi:hypothetical protein
MAVLTTDLTAAFIPGASPPLVKTPIRFILAQNKKAPDISEAFYVKLSLN